MTFFRSWNSRFAALGAVAALAVAVSGRSALAQGNYNLLSPTEQYLTMRRLYPPTRGLTPEQVAQNANAYRGQTLEIEGMLSGIVSHSGGGALVLMNTEKYGSLNLTMSSLPTWVQTGARLRVLVVVPGADENKITVGIPDFQVVALASQSDLGALEVQWRQEEARRAEALRKREAAIAAYKSRSGEATTGVSRATHSSRSATSAFTRIPGSSVAAALSQDAQGVFPTYRAFITKWNPRLTDNQADGITASLLLYCERYDVDPRLMVALIIAESDFRPGITSNKGAMGIAQLMPDEAKDLGLSNPYDPVQNIGGSVYLMKRLLDKFSGGASQQDLQMQHIILALASYNAGEGAVKKYKGVPPYRETQNYVKKIEKIYRALCQNDSAGGVRP